MPRFPNIVGVDGCKAGWFAIRLYGQNEYEVGVFPAFEELVRCYIGVDLILVDIPIGLPEDATPRECDREARGLLERRRSSVFPTPTRQAVEQASSTPKDYAAASAVEECYAGKKLNQQTFNIAAKIAEVDSVLRGRGDGVQPHIREIHPEVCFWALNGNQAMALAKKKKDGFKERIALLRRLDPSIDAIVEAAERKYLRREVAWDDIADALVAVVTGYHGYSALQTIPANVPTDAKGLPMEMVFWKP